MIEIIDLLKPKNQGTFPIVEAVDVAVSENKRLSEALSEIRVTPEMYGAVGDGLTDDTEAVLLAVQNGEVALTGIYRITGVIKIPKNCHITVAGGYFSVDTFNTDTQAGGWVYFENPNYPVTPEMFGAIGDGTADDTKAIQNAIDANLNPLVFPIGKTQAEAGKVHTKYNSLVVNFERTYKISDEILIRAEQHFNPLVIEGNNKANILGSSTDEENYVEYGIRVKKPDNYPTGDQDTQTRKHIRNLGMMRFQNAISIEGCDWDSSVQHCFFQDVSANAIYIASSDGVLVADNYCCWVWGKFIRTYYSNACKIINNHSGEYGSNGAGGILISSGTNSANIISNNVLKGCGIYVSTRVNVGDIISNNVIAYAAKGIEIPSNSKGLNIYGNSFKNCTIGAQISTEHSFSKNYFFNCTTGVHVAGYQTANIFVSDCDFENCTTGIYHTKESWSSIFKNNIFRDNTTAIEAEETSMKSAVDGNTFINCDHYYTRLPSDAGNNPIFGTNYSSENGFETGELTEPEIEEENVEE